MSLQSNLFFIDGPGGTGKTFTYNALLAAVRAEGGIALAVASSGVAALLLPGGSTAHGRFKIPIILHEASHCNVPKDSPLADLFRRCRLIVWDEAPMVSRLAYEALDRTFRDITGVRTVMHACFYMGSG